MVMDIVKSLNLSVRFLLELCLLAALAYGGFNLTNSLLLSWFLGLGLPAFAASVWALRGPEGAKTA